MVQGFARDIRIGVRSLGRQPGFVAVVVLTLALGIGATTTVFSAFQGVLLDPLPYDDPADLVRLYNVDADSPDELQYVTGAHFAAYRDETTSFEQVAALYTYSERGVDLVTGDRAERLRVLPVSGGYFDVLGARPVLGRGIVRSDETDERRVVLSHQLWRTRFDADPSVIGSAVRLDDEPYTVIGVGPSGLQDPLVGDVDGWVPHDLRPGGGRDHPQNHHLSVIARLEPGVGITGARADLERADALLKERFPEQDAGARLVPLQADLVRGADRTLGILLAAVGLVLLVACVNVANLFLVRASTRERELSIRAALGSGRARLVRQLLSESLLLALAGGVGGVVLAVVGVELLESVARGSVPRIDNVGVDGTVLAFAATVAVGTGLLFGIVPALRFSQARAEDALRAVGRANTGGRRAVRLRDALVVGQVALALMLLVGAGLLVSSFHRLGQVDLGFRTEGVTTFRVNLPAARYDADGRARFHTALSERLRAIPGVTAAGAVSRLPGTGTYHSWGSRPLSGPLAGTTEWFGAEQRVVAGAYFEAAGIHVLEGRLFSDLRVEGRAGDGREAVLSREAAERLFPGVSAVGQRIQVGGDELDVVGVVSDVALTPEGAPTPAIYHDHEQFAGNRNWGLVQVVATDLRDSSALLPSLRNALAELDPRLVVDDPTALAEIVGRGVGQRRFALVLLVTFALLALALAALGLYGVLAFSVRQRTRELAIRSALGADRTVIRRMVLAHGAIVTGIGVLAGTVGALALGRVLSSLVFRTSTADPVVIGLAVTGLMAAALGASWIPARRATAVDPRQALEGD